MVVNPMSEPNQSVNETLDKARESLGRGCCDCCKNLEEKIREAPLASALITVAIGYLLSVFPLGALFRAVLKVSLALVKPGLLIFGVIKLVEYLRTNGAGRMGRSNGDSERDPVIDSPVGPPPA
jgi:hypothetical protein